MIVKDTLPLRMKNIHVSYEACQALKGVDFDLYKGEIHGLVGEHRAGKSTLVKLLSGAVKKDRDILPSKGKIFSILPLNPRSNIKSALSINISIFFPP